VCSNPSGIQAQLSETMMPFGRGNNNLKISPTLGLTCLNSEQINGRCQDYRVRFCCKGKKNYNLITKKRDKDTKVFSSLYY